MVLLAFVWTVQSAQGIDERLEGRVFRTGSEYFAVTPPEVVVPVDAQQLQWSPNGRYLFIEGVKPNNRPVAVSALLAGAKADPPPRLLFVWSRESGKLRELGRVPAEVGYVSCTFVGSNGSAFLQFDQIEGGTVWFAGAGATTLKKVLDFDSRTILNLTGSPTLELAVATRYEGSKRSALVMTPAGLQPAVNLPDKSHLSLWDATGNSVEVSLTGLPRDTRAESRLVFRAASGLVETTESFTPYEPTPISSTPLELAKAASIPSQLLLRPVVDEVVKGIGGVVGEGITDRDETALSDTRDGAAFESNGVVYAASVVKIDAAQFKVFADLKMKREAMNNAKQAALGVMMFLGDNDDKFPSHDAFYSSVSPYLKNDDIMRSFTYTYGGPEDVSKVEKPAETELGYVDTPVGRAIAYADGHVKWFGKK